MIEFLGISKFGTKKNSSFVSSPRESGRQRTMEPNIWVCLKMLCTPLYPMVCLIIIPIKWLFHWEYTLFSDKPICRFLQDPKCRIQKVQSHFKQVETHKSGPHLNHLIHPHQAGSPAQSPRWRPRRSPPHRSGPSIRLVPG